MLLIEGSLEYTERVKLLRDYYDSLKQDEIRSRQRAPEGLTRRESDIWRKGFLSRQINQNGYGNDIDTIFILLICREAGYDFKVRKRYHLLHKTIYVDCILDYFKTIEMPLKQQKLYLLQELKKTFTSIQTYKKKLKEFDFDSFEKDIQKILDDEIIRIENEAK
jgi:hypothetical protein